MRTRKDGPTDPRFSWFSSPSLQSRGRDRILTNSHPWNRNTPLPTLHSIYWPETSVSPSSPVPFLSRRVAFGLKLYRPALSRPIAVMCGSKIRTTHSTVIRAARAGDPHTLTVLRFLPLSVLGPRVYSVESSVLCAVLSYTFSGTMNSIPTFLKCRYNHPSFQIPTSSPSWSPTQEHMQEQSLKMSTDV